MHVRTGHSGLPPIARCKKSINGEDKIPTRLKAPTLNFTFKGDL